MKKNIFLFSLFLTLFVFLPTKNSRAQVSVNFQVFYTQMAPYGSWVSYPSYGYVWIPRSVPRGFRPYGTGGHWIYTSEGWTWMSDYSWGWAAFHYGNWFYDDNYGWMWIPGYDWAPAWVTWGEYGNNYCWAPIGPHIQIGASWNSYRPPYYYWNFIPRAYIMRADMNRYYVHQTNVTVINQITVINNINSGTGRPVYMRGPQANNVERYTRTPVRPVIIRGSATPGRGRVENGQLAIYRPEISRNPSRPVTPQRVVRLESIKPSSLPAYNRNPHPATKPAVQPPVAREENRPARPVAKPVQPPVSGGQNSSAQPQSRHAQPNPRPVQPPAAHQQNGELVPEPHNTSVQNKKAAQQLEKQTRTDNRQSLPVRPNNPPSQQPHDRSAVQPTQPHSDMQQRNPGSNAPPKQHESGGQQPPSRESAGGGQQHPPHQQSPDKQQPVQK
jgi:hypothetical protein